MHFWLLTLLLFLLWMAGCGEDDGDESGGGDTSGESDSDSDTAAGTGTTGELVVTVTTSSTGGQYAPRHLLAIWVENAQGDFIRTLMAYTSNPAYRGYLSHWDDATSDAGARYDTTDAVSGATLSSHDTRTATWDATRFDNGNLPDGAYSVCMELTDKNATGNYSCFEFNKGVSNDLASPGDTPSFSDVTLDWSPR